MAGRKAKPWFRSERRAWFVTIAGKRHPLGPDKVEAFQRFHELMAGVERPSKNAVDVVPSSLVTLNDVADRYLVWYGRRAKPDTVSATRCYLKPLLAALGTKPIDQLTPADIDQAVHDHGTWNQTTEHHARSRLVSALAWATKNRVIPTNPLAGLWRPPARSRGAEVIASGGEIQRLLSAAPEYLRDVLTVLQNTGARPCEVRTVTAADFDPAAAVWILRDHKTADMTGKVRVVFLPPDVVELCKRLAAKHPTGPLFRQQRGAPFTSAAYLARLVRMLRRKLNLPETIIPYGFRHSFATDALANGVPEAHVAELLGHKGTAMLHKHYAHLGTKAAVLRAALGKVRG